MLSSAHRELLKTIGNAQRFEIMMHLRQSPLNVNQIVEKTGLKQTAASHHLRRLRQCRFVEVKEQGRERVYSVRRNPVDQLFRLLDQHAEKYCRYFCIPSQKAQ